MKLFTSPYFLNQFTTIYEIHKIVRNPSFTHLIEELLKKVKPHCEKVLGTYINVSSNTASITKHALYDRQRSFRSYQQKHHIFSTRNHPGRGKAIIRLYPEQHRELHYYFDYKKNGKTYILLPHEQLLLLVQRQEGKLEKWVYDLMYTTLASLSPSEIYKPLFVKKERQKKASDMRFFKKCSLSLQCML